MQTKNETDIRDHFKRSAELASGAAEAIREYIRFAVLPRLALLLLEEARARLVDASNAIGDLLTPDEVPDEAPPTHAPAGAKPSGAHRHKFDTAGICTACGKVKSANGRKPAGAPAAELSGLPADARTLPIPATRPLGDAVADRYADGGQGSSGVRR